ncbi:MAG: phage tail tube protein [Candidatus Thiodiazotropha sp.]
MALNRKTLILAAVETVPGVDEVPTATDAIVIADPNITPLAGSTVSRNNTRPFLGNNQHIHVGSHVMMDFKVEVAGSGGAVDDEPMWGRLLRGCGMPGAPNAGVSYDFTPDSDSTDTLTLYFFKDGQFHPMIGARGTFSIEIGKNQIPYFNFTFTGLWVDPSSAANPVPVYSQPTPLPVSNVNTPTVSLHAHDAVLENLTINYGNQVVHSDRPNEEIVRITDRATDGNISLVAPALSVKNFFTTAKANALGAMSIVHGITATNIVSFSSSRAQILSPTYGDANGEATLQAGMSFIPTDAGDDELLISSS